MAREPRRSARQRPSQSDGDQSIKPALSKPKPPLKNVSIRGLFGKFDFPTISLGHGGYAPHLTLLYGENGVGKTTILNLLYALLSNESNRGRRRYLATVKFREISVEFEDGQKVSARRDDIEQAGYHLSITGPRGELAGDVRLNDSGRVSSAENPVIKSYNRVIGDIAPTLIFVSDQRTVKSNYAPWDVMSAEFGSAEKNYSYYQKFVEDPAAFIDDALGDALARMLASIDDLFASRALRDVTTASSDIGQIYLSLARAVMDKGRKQIRNKSKASVLARIASIQRYLSHFGRFNLVQGEALEGIKQLLRDSPSEDISALIQVGEPYISSVEKRIEATRVLAKEMATFVDGVNGFLSRKRIVTQIGQPTAISDDDGNPLDLHNLSSGERHLLFLFCTALLSRGKNTLTIIDEPELSLNYKWQQKLMRSLLKMSGTEQQFLLATHSFEIISEFEDNLVTLSPSKKRPSRAAATEALN